ncbi:hypothetical protein NQ176_g11016 [Zarea fungicola]|uniref:Uncharacterized protein n=1 Tax=Zarea fungicola TaxID=93591 RepID=A0ACC1MED8_9HYPO|nr:hypothetical protein NQ176_g11016 [Lecanicillium fungicola]
MGLHDAVNEANVYGVALPNHDGRAGCAAITFAAGPPSKATLQSLADHVVKNLPRYAVPLFIRVVDEEAAREQKTGTNKQQKHVLRKEGVDPSNGGSQLFWLRDSTYVPFGDDSWSGICRGQVKL